MLKAGDVIQTRPGAEVELTLSDGSIVSIGEKTELDIAMLGLEPETKVRTSRLKLLYGHLRAFLSPGHQEEGSSFTVETPNAQVEVKFSEPDVEVSYDPETQTTIARAYTVDISVINTLTEAEVKSIPKGHQAIVHDEYILVTKITEVSGLIEELQRMTRDKRPADVEEEVMAEDIVQTRLDLLLATRSGAIGAISDAPGAGEPTTSQNPTQGKRATRPENRLQPVGFTFTIMAE